MNGYNDLSIDRLFRLDSDVAFVTGGGDGFGRIASMAYANAGASVAVTDIDKDKADAVVAEITAGGGTRSRSSSTYRTAQPSNRQ
jgi:NAD(P)-dependent dehydrogenase (short-subunit alcohol dehydrogenase family)